MKQQTQHDSSGVEPGANPPAGDRTTWKMLLLAIWVSFAAWMANFDSGFAGVVIIMPSFNTAFGECHQVPDPVTGEELIQQCHLTALQQSLISVGNLFGGIGGIASGVLGYHLGRRRMIQFACVLVLGGAAGMLGTAGSYLNFMVCKCIGNAGIGILQAVAIVYGTECVSANRRGFLLGLFNVGLGMGNVAVSAVCAGSAKLNASNNWQWRVPILCQIPLALVLSIGMEMFPESPRWLLLKGREDEARNAFASLLAEDPHGAAVSEMVTNVQHYIKLENEMSRTSSWTEIYRGIDLRRTMISALILIALAITGIQFVAPYAALFLSNVGISNPYLINVIIGLCIFTGTLFGPLILDRGGRRFAMLVGFSGMTICMLILSSVSSGLGQDNPIAKIVVVVFLCLWALIFGGFIGSSLWLASAEMHSVRLRTYGQASTTTLYSIFSFGATFWTPYMLSKDYGNMGTRVGYFYAAITVAVLILVFLFVPETAYLSLEQIDGFFLSGEKAWKTSTAKNKAMRYDMGFDELTHAIETKHNCPSPTVEQVENSS